MPAGISFYLSMRTSPYDDVHDTRRIHCGIVNRQLVSRLEFVTIESLVLRMAKCFALNQVQHDPDPKIVAIARQPSCLLQGQTCVSRPLRGIHPAGSPVVGRRAYDAASRTFGHSLRSSGGRVQLREVALDRQRTGVPAFRQGGSDEFRRAAPSSACSTAASLQPNFGHEIRPGGPEDH